MYEMTMSVLRKLGAAGLSLLLASCGTARHTVIGPTGAQDLARYVLVIEELSDGQVTHAWRPVQDFDVTQYLYSTSSGFAPGRIVRVAATSHCDARQQICIDLCTNSPRPIPIEGERYPSYLGSWAKNRGHWCQSTCTKFHQLCIRGLGPWAERAVHEFSEIDSAVDWVKSHREEIVVGTVVVIAGVAFVAAVAGSGGAALCLIPLVALASVDPLAGMTTESRVAEVVNADP